MSIENNSNRKIESDSYLPFKGLKKDLQNLAKSLLGEKTADPSPSSQSADTQSAKGAKGAAKTFMNHSLDIRSEIFLGKLLLTGLSKAREAFKGPSTISEEQIIEKRQLLSEEIENTKIIINTLENEHGADSAIGQKLIPALEQKIIFKEKELDKLDKTLKKINPQSHYPVEKKLLKDLTSAEEKLAKNQKIVDDYTINLKSHQKGEQAYTNIAALRNNAALLVLDAEIEIQKINIQIYENIIDSHQEAIQKLPPNSDKALELEQAISNLKEKILRLEALIAGLEGKYFDIDDLFHSNNVDELKRQGAALEESISLNPIDSKEEEKRLAYIYLSLSELRENLNIQKQTSSQGIDQNQTPISKNEKYSELSNEEIQSKLEALQQELNTFNQFIQNGVLEVKEGLVLLEKNQTDIDILSKIFQERLNSQ